MDLTAAARRLAHLGHDYVLSAASPILTPVNLQRTVLVLGTGRGGTTLVMNALAQGMDASVLFEPFRPESSRRARQLVPSHGYLRCVANDCEGERSDYLRAVLRGREHTRWSTNQTDRWRMRQSTALVVKEVRLNRCTGWIDAVDPDLPIRAVVRHPVRVIASMLSARGGWSDMSYEDLVPPAADALSITAHDMASPDDSRAVWLACLWLADTVCLLRELREDHLNSSVLYEDVLRDGSSAMTTLAEGLGPFDHLKALDSLKRPSATASADFRRAAGDSDVRSFLAPGDRDRLRGLLADFRLPLYDVDSARPACSLLEAKAELRKG